MTSSYERWTEPQIRALSMLEEMDGHGYVDPTPITRDLIARGLLSSNIHTSRVVPNVLRALARRGYVKGSPAAFVRGFTTGSPSDARMMYEITDVGREKLRELRTLML